MGTYIISEDAINEYSVRSREAERRAVHTTDVNSLAVGDRWLASLGPPIDA